MNPLAQFSMNFKYAFRPRKPRLVARLADAVVRAKLPGPPRLRYVDFATHFACNLRCEHCFAATLHQPGRRSMTPDDYARVADQAMALGAVNFSFQGGEPLIDKRLPQIITACKPDRNVISVTTNGTMLDDRRVRMLRAIGVDIVTVSLDSGDPTEHDRFRRKDGVHYLATEGIDRVLAAGMNVTIGTVVTHQNLHTDGMRDLCDYAKRKRVLMYFILPVPAGKWQNESRMMLTDDDLATIDNLTTSSPFLRTDFQANLRAHGCGAAKEILYLTPYGDVLTCPFLHIGFGNIFDDNLATIRDRALANPYFARYHDKCLVSTDREFIDKYLSQTWNAEQLPLSHKILSQPRPTEVASNAHSGPPGNDAVTSLPVLQHQ